jgi:hypothetical protein
VYIPLLFIIYITSHSYIFHIHTEVNMGIEKRASSIFVPTRPTGGRGNVAKRIYNNLHLDKKRSTGRQGIGAIQKLFGRSKAGFGGKTTDGVNSQTGCMTLNARGYKGNFTPLVKLMKQSGWKPLKTAHSYVASANLGPSVYSSVDPIGKLGVQPTKPSIIQNRQSDDVYGMLPPGQTGNCKQGRRVSMTAKHRGGRLPAENYRTGGVNMVINNKNNTNKFVKRIHIDPLNQQSIHDEKFDDPTGDPNPFYPLEPFTPDEQQGMQPMRMQTKDHYRFANYLPNGHLVKTSQDTKYEKGKKKHFETRGISSSDVGLARAAVDNALWSGMHNQEGSGGLGGRDGGGEGDVNE